MPNPRRFNIDHVSYLEKEIARLIVKILSLADPARPSFNSDVLARRYGLELARCGKELKRRQQPRRR